MREESENSGQWAVGSGQWAVGSGQWAVWRKMGLSCLGWWSYFWGVK